MLAGVTAAGDPDPLSVVDSGRNVDGELGPLDPAAASAADLAWVASDATVTTALVAHGRPDHLAERGPGDRAHLAGTGALRAGLDRRARLGAVAVAVLTA